MEDKRQEVMRVEVGRPSDGIDVDIRWHGRGKLVSKRKGVQVKVLLFKLKFDLVYLVNRSQKGDHLDGIQIKVANRCCGMGYDYEQIRVGWVGGCGGCSRRYKWVPDCCEWPTQEGTQGVTSHSLLIVLIVNISQGLLLNFRISDILTVLNHHASSTFWLHLAFMAHC